MRIERSPVRMRERDQCVSGIRANEKREKSHEEEGKRSLREIRTNENRAKSCEDERKGSLCKRDLDQ
jgi:hypothetical protein